MADGDWVFGIGVLVLGGGFGLLEYLNLDITVSPEILLGLTILPYVTLGVMVYVAWVWIPNQVEEKSDAAQV